MTLDIAMGGSTNTVLHILAIAHEAGVDFTMKDIDRLSRKVPNICKVAPSSSYHVEDVHRAGGIFSDPRRARSRRAHPPRRRHRARARRWAKPSTQNDLRRAERDAGSANGARWRRPAACRRRSPSRRTSTSASADDDAREGLHPRRRRTPTARTAASRCSTATSPTEGCIVKTAGVDESILKFEGPARVFHSQEAACDAIMADQIKSRATSSSSSTRARRAAPACRRCCTRRRS